MLKQCIIAGAIALCSVTVLAGTDTPAGYETVTVQGYQGPAMTLTVPLPSNQVEAPYALTGQQAPAQPPSILEWLGNGPPVWVPR